LEPLATSILYPFIFWGRSSERLFRDAIGKMRSKLLSNAGRRMRPSPDFAARCWQATRATAIRWRAATCCTPNAYKAVDQFERDRIQEVQDTAAGLDDAGRRKASEMVRAMRRAAAELRTKEIESNVDADGLAERYGIE
jgi:hypothetical protein